MDIEKEKGKRFNIPIVYITQLLSLCLGVSREKIGLSKLMISPDAVVNAVVAAV